MNKLYKKPETSVVRIVETAPLATSGVGGNNGMSFGGFDKKGLDADAPSRRNPFENPPFGNPFGLPF